MIVPVVIIFVSENVGHVKAVGLLTNRNLDEYVGRALIGDALAMILSSCFGGTGKLII